MVFFAKGPNSIVPLPHILRRGTKKIVLVSSVVNSGENESVHFRHFILAGRPTVGTKVATLF